MRYGCAPGRLDCLRGALMGAVTSDDWFIDRNPSICKDPTYQPVWLRSASVKAETCLTPALTSSLMKGKHPINRSDVCDSRSASDARAAPRAATVRNMRPTWCFVRDDQVTALQCQVRISRNEHA